MLVPRRRALLRSLQHERRKNREDFCEPIRGVLSHGACDGEAARGVGDGADALDVFAASAAQQQADGGEDFMERRALVCPLKQVSGERKEGLQRLDGAAMDRCRAIGGKPRCDRRQHVPPLVPWDTHACLVKHIQPCGDEVECRGAEPLAGGSVRCRCHEPREEERPALFNGCKSDACNILHSPKGPTVCQVWHRGPLLVLNALQRALERGLKCDMRRRAEALPSQPRFNTALFRAPLEFECGDLEVCSRRSAAG